MSAGLEDLRGLARLRAVLGAPGTGALLFARTLGSLPVGMVPLGIILLLRASGRSYALAGIADGAFALGVATMQPPLGHLIDRLGMARVLVPLALAFSSVLVALALSGSSGAPASVDVALALVSGACMPPLGACMRTLWPTLISSDALRPAAYAIDATLQEVAFVLGPPLVALAVAHGRALPDQPDAAALQRFLAAEKQADPERFPDLSLSVIKLMGPGEYALELPGGASAGHFGLAVQDYTHSTAPNRRYPDVITQRLLKAAIAGQPSPYANDALAALALRCTDRQDAAKKVERQVAKSAAAILLERRIGARFPALVTGASEKGTWVRIAQPAVEGKVVQGGGAWTVGARVLVELVHVDVEAGHIDFRSVAAIK